MIACHHNNEELVQLLLKYNADPNIRTKRNITALLFSTSNPIIFHMLLDHGADSGIIATSMKQTALHLACMSGNLKIVETMIKRHPTFIDMTTITRCTPLWFASHEGHLPVVKKLIEERANLDIPDNDGVTPLLKALYNEFVPVAYELLKAKANPNCRNRVNDLTPLLIATLQSNLLLVEKLLERTADPNVFDCHGQSPLWMASIRGNLEIVEKLLQAKADPNLLCAKHCKIRTTALYAASEKGHLAIVERLLKWKADPNLHAKKFDDSAIPLQKAQDDSKTPDNTPLFAASKKGHVGIVELLLKAHADPNIQNSNGTTALMMAVRNKHLSVVEKLLEFKADPSISSVHGKSSWDLANKLVHSQSKESFEVCSLILNTIEQAMKE